MSGRFSCFPLERSGNDRLFSKKQKWADFCIIIKKMTLDLTLEDFFLFFFSNGFRADTETTLLLFAAFLPFFPPLWHFDIRTEQQYAQAFSPLSPPLSSALGPSLFNCGGKRVGVGTSWPGEYWQQSQSQTMTSSLQDWQALKAHCALTRRSPVCMHKLAWALS